MAGVKISNLPPATTPLAGNELAPIVRAGVTERVTVAEISNAAFAVFNPTDDISADTVQLAIEELVTMIASGDSALNTGFTPYGNISATNVQYAIQELDDETVKKTSDTGSALMPLGTTAERDVSPVNGALRYNTEDSVWEYYDSLGWFALNPIPTANATVFTPYGTIAATNVQLAIQELLDETVYKTGLNGSAELPSGNTAQRDVTPTQGAIRYDTTLSVWEGWNGAAWSSFGISGGTIGPASDVTFTPYGNIAATNVQTALQELDDETVKKTSATGSALLPTGTTAQRDGSPTTGAARYNTSLTMWEGWNGSAWVGLGVSTAASNIAFTPYGTIAATTVQGALQELSDEKVAKAGDTMTGNLLGPTVNFDVVQFGRSVTATYNFALLIDGTGQAALQRLGGSPVNIFVIGTGNNVAFINDVTAFSDERRKTNWKSLPVDFVDSLASVKSGTFERTDGADDSRHIGVSAQSLRTVMPEAVVTDGDGYLSVAYGNAALAACIELAKEVKRLQARLDAVEGLL